MKSKKIELLYDWIDEMEKEDYYIPSASFTWDNMIDFAEWYHNKLKR